MTKKNQAAEAPAPEAPETQEEPKTKLEYLLGEYYNSEVEEETEHLAKLIFHTKMSLIRDAIGPVEKTKNQGEKFASMKHGDVVSAVRPQLTKVGLSVMPLGLHSHGFIPQNITRYRGGQNGQPATPYEVTLYQAQVNLKYKIVCLDTGYEEIIQADGAAINNEGDPAKSFGSALSYTKKYLYMQTFDINDTASDPDAGSNQESPYTDPGQYQKQAKQTTKGNQASAPAQPTPPKALKAIAPAEFTKLKEELLAITDLATLEKKGAELVGIYDFKPVQLAALKNEIGSHKAKLQEAANQPEA